MSTFNTIEMSIPNMLLARAKLDSDIRQERIHTVIKAIAAMRGNASVHMAPGCAVLRLEKQLVSELAVVPMRNVFVDDILDQLELVLDIDYE